jgi:phytoene dehydrogenase-like protein
MIVIGAGVAGLSAGCYARMNGYRTEILEMNDTPGGLCTSWKRKGYTFDASLAGLAGSSPASAIYRLWQELGVAEGCQLFHGEELGRVVGPDGQVFVIHSDVDALESEMNRISPEDSRTSAELCRAIRKLLPFDPPFPHGSRLAAAVEYARFAGIALARLPLLIGSSRVSLGGFASRFRHLFLARAIGSLSHFGGAEVPLLAILLPLAYSHRKAVGMPVGGWLAFARAMESRFLGLGGAIRYNARAARIIVENGAARGVVLTDGAEVRADIVVSAADGRTTLFEMLGERYLDEGLRAAYRTDRVSDQPVQVNIGVARDFSDQSHTVSYLLPEPVEVVGRTHERMTVGTHSFDPSMAPAGKASLTVFWSSDHRFWQELAADPARYGQEKEKAADATIKVMESHHPGFARQVEVTDVSTPLTRALRTGNWLGAMQGWRADPDMLRALLSKRASYELHSVRGFYMAGQWAEAWGGITTAAQSGRKVMQLILSKEGRKLATTV